MAFNCFMRTKILLDALNFSHLENLFCLLNSSDRISPCIRRNSAFPSTYWSNLEIES